MALFRGRSTGDAIFDIANVVIVSVIILVVLYPMIYVVSASFSNPLDVLQGKVWLLPKGVNFDAYQRVFMNQDILIGYKNSIVYALVGTSVNLGLTIMGAYPLSRKEFYGRSAIMLLFAFTMFFSGGIIPTYLLVKSLGLLNHMWAVIIPGAVSMWNLIIMRTFFQNTIPGEMYEAAFMDGCSDLGILFKIVLPLSTPIMAVMVLFYGVSHWNSFFDALLYLSDRNKYPLQLILRDILIQNQMQDMMDDDSDAFTNQVMLTEGLKYAVILVSSLPVLILYPLLQRYFVKGVMVGAIKG